MILMQVKEQPVDLGFNVRPPENEDSPRHCIRIVCCADSEGKNRKLLSVERGDPNLMNFGGAIIYKDIEVICCGNENFYGFSSTSWLSLTEIPCRKVGVGATTYGKQNFKSRKNNWQVVC